MTTTTSHRSPPGVTRARVFAALRAHLAKHGYPPTVRELCVATGLSSTSTCAAHLHQLRSAGQISFEDGKPRTLCIVEARP